MKKIKKSLLITFTIAGFITCNTHAQNITVPTNNATDYMIKKINAYRDQQGLAPVQKNDETCNFAKIRAQEIMSHYSHDGFNQRLTNGTLPYSNWVGATENIAMADNYKQVVSIWVHSASHAKNMRADTPFVCVIQNGRYFAYEGMKAGASTP